LVEGFCILSRFWQPSILETSQQLETQFRLRMDSIPYTLHQTKINNVHNMYSHSWGVGKLIKNKIEEVHNQENKILIAKWYKTANPLFFSQLEGSGLILWERGSTFFFKPRSYIFNEPEPLL
jgi:hypothetical protein